MNKIDLAIEKLRGVPPAFLDAPYFTDRITSSVYFQPDIDAPAELICTVRLFKSRAVEAGFVNGFKKGVVYRIVDRPGIDSNTLVSGGILNYPETDLLSVPLYKLECVNSIESHKCICWFRVE